MSELNETNLNEAEDTLDISPVGKSNSLSNLFNSFWFISVFSS